MGAPTRRAGAAGGRARALGFRAGLGLYVHWPFCLSKCPYCDFNSHVRTAVDEARWRNALVAELDHFAALTPGRTVTSIFFGGGTPSLMDPATVAALLERAGLRWRIAADVEVTLEANPTSAEAANFRALRRAGVNRLSLGIQALDDAALRFLGRGHDRSQALAALAQARAVFPRVSFDLIYVRPHQTAAAWRAELAEALTLAADHVSLYQLVIEEGTAFHAALARGELEPLGERAAATLYEVTQEATHKAGLPAYEISNHAAPGAECRHNLTYWRYGEYVGVGPGAHGRLGPAPGPGPGPDEQENGAGKRALRQIRSPEAWLESVEARRHGTAESVALAPRERMEEMLMMGLRLREGVSRAAFRREVGRDLEAALDSARLVRLLDGGDLVLDRRALRASPAGRRRLNAVLAHLLA
jgi:oxygen-independent coproporphyrinogen-3 oxidase